MVNLLGRRTLPDAPPRFDPSVRPALEARLASIFALARAERLGAVARATAELAAELEELDGLAGASGRLGAESLLAAVDRLRREALVGTSARHPGARVPGVPGDFVCHRPGRSLATGEAEIASRGYFDEWDRPPLATWLGVLPARADEGGSDVYVVAWIAASDCERAWAGIRACPNGALVRLEEVSSEAVSELRAAAAAAALDALA